MTEEANRTIVQTGLYSKDGKAVESLVKRVDDWNKFNIGRQIMMDVIPFEKGDKENGMDFPHYKLRFKYPNKQAQRQFWTGT